MIFLVEHFRLSLMRQRRLKWKNNMVAVYNIGQIPWDVLWYRIVDHFLLAIALLEFW